MIKKITTILTAAIVMAGIGGATKASAKDFGMSLAPSQTWRYLTDAPDCADTKDGTGSTGYISLNEICEAKSYYVYAKAVNYYGQDRAYETTVAQYEQNHTIYEHDMVRYYTYYLALKNTTWTSGYVWTSGQFGWY
ncbi:MAG: hypothetical protein ABRQ25_07160 [Clostridiaceae bacterium]